MSHVSFCIQARSHRSQSTKVNITTTYSSVVTPDC
uniref:Uncharacterized protein n=1 Tax=Anguilla anguilla TaxID=7936 RepID=A0A0E9RND6_ANGAN